MPRELTIYCDESDISGKHFSNFYGGALVESIHLEEVIKRLTAKKAELNLGAEVKWQKITANYLEKYIAFVDEIFDLVHEGLLKIRIMFTQNYYAAIGLSRQQREETFFKLYYQFVKHGFGLSYAGYRADGETKVRIYFDKLPDNQEKCEQFKGFVLGLNGNVDFKRAGIVIKKDQLAEVDSKEHVALQSLDLVMGAIQFRLNDKHLEIPDGQKRRGKRTVAKEKVYKHVLKRIQERYAHFNIGISTGVEGDHTNRWRHPYRHWKFVPTEWEAAPQYAKRK